MNRSQKSFLYAGLATLCWSTVASAFKLTLDTLQNDVFTMLFYSVLFSLIVLFLTVLSQGKGRELLNVSAKGIVSSMLLGLVNPFLYYEDRFYRIDPPQVKVINSIGSGDGVAAGISVGMVRGLSLIESVRLGIACGTANCKTPIAGVVYPNDVQAMIPKVRLESL